MSIVNRNLTYFSIASSLPYKRRRVFNVILRLANATNQDIADELGISINEVTGRTNELCNIFLIKPCGDRLVNNRHHTVFEVIKDDKERIELIEDALIDLRIKKYQLEADLTKVCHETKVILKAKIKHITNRINELTKIQNLGEKLPEKVG